MKMFDVMFSNKGKVEVVCEMYTDSLEKAISAVKSLPGYSKAKYIGHVVFEIVNNHWQVVESTNMDAVA